MASTSTQPDPQAMERAARPAEQRTGTSKRERMSAGLPVNVGLLERIGSGIVGAMLGLWGVWSLTRGRSILGGLSLAATGAGLAYRGATGHCPAYQATGVTRDDASATSHPLNRFVHVSRRIRVNRPVNELYAYWRDFNNLPRIMRHLERVEVHDDRRSHWVAAAPRGHVSWDAEITDDRPNERIAWRSSDEASVPNHGHVRFESPGDGHGSIVEVSLDYRPPAGAIGAGLARVFGEAPPQQLQEDLRRFKQVMETGETATTVGQPRGRCK